MEKQQEILFSIVSESKNNAQRQSYPPMNTPSNSLLYHIDPFLRMSAEQKVNPNNASAFKPSKPSLSPPQHSGAQVTPIAHQAQNGSNRLPIGGHGSNSLSHVQLLSEICSSILNKQL